MFYNPKYYKDRPTALGTVRQITLIQNKQLHQIKVEVIDLRTRIRNLTQINIAQRKLIRELKAQLSKRKRRE